ncbi:MAG: peroxiredoxin [Meiothermus sp.]
MAISTPARLPDVTVYTAGAEPKQLPELAGGKPTVLLFFPAAHTRVCERELCTFRDGLSQYNDLGVQVYGISVDTPWTLAAYMKELGLSFPLISDYDKAATRALGLEIRLRGLPGFSQRAAYVVGADGKIAWSWVADVPSQEPPYEEIIRAVQALG